MADPMILELLWLKKWNLSIDWGTNKWHLRNKVKKVQAGEKPPKAKKMPLAEKVKVEPVNLLAENKQAKLSIPKEYCDLVEVFRSRNGTYSPYTISQTVQLKYYLGQSYPNQKIHSMIPREMAQLLSSFVDKNLARGFIQTGRSRIAAPVPFKEKKGNPHSLHATDQ